MHHQAYTICCIATILLLACTSVVLSDPSPVVYEKDGKVIVHDEAIIPTHTVTQYATVTQTKTFESTITPTISVHELRANEPMPVIDDNATLIKKILVDVTVDARYANMTQNWFRQTSSAATSTILSSSVAAIFVVVLTACLFA